MSGFDALERWAGTIVPECLASASDARASSTCDSLEQITWVVGLGEELIDLQVGEGGEVVFDDGGAADDHGLRRF